MHKSAPKKYTFIKTVIYTRAQIYIHVHISIYRNLITHTSTPISYIIHTC